MVLCIEVDVTFCYCVLSPHIRVPFVHNTCPPGDSFSNEQLPAPCAVLLCDYILSMHPRQKKKKRMASLHRRVIILASNRGWLLATYRIPEVIRCYQSLNSTKKKKGKKKGVLSRNHVCNIFPTFSCPVFFISTVTCHHTLRFTTQTTDMHLQHTHMSNLCWLLHVDKKKGKKRGLSGLHSPKTFCAI